MSSSYLVSMSNSISPSSNFHRRFNQTRKAPSIKYTVAAITKGDGIEGTGNSNDNHKEKLKQRLLQDDFCGHLIGFTDSREAAIKAAMESAREHGIKIHGNDSEINFLAFRNCLHNESLCNFGEKNGISGHFVEYGDLEAVQKLFNEAKPAAVFVEPVHLNGNGSVEESKKFLKYIRITCDLKGALLVFDEYESGFGRTGNLWAYKAYDVPPHMVMINVPPSNKGLTMGALIAPKDIDYKCLTLEALIAPKGIDLSRCDLKSYIFKETNEFLGKVFDDVTSTFSPEVLKKSDVFVEELKREMMENPYLKEIRHIGLLVEIELCNKTWNVAKKGSKVPRARFHQDRVVFRLLPSLISSLEELCVQAKEFAALVRRS